MSKDPVTVTASLGLNELLRQHFLGSGQQKQQGYLRNDKENLCISLVARSAR